MVTDQPNIVLDSGTRDSLDPCCHHQIIHCKVNFKIPPPPPYERKIWHFHRGNIAAIKRSMTSFPWHQHLSINSNPNWQVKTFTEVLLNIMANFIPNETKKIVPRDPPWITKHLKATLKRKNRLFKNFKKHGYKEEDRIRLEVFRTECQEAVESAKSTYLHNLGEKLSDSNTSQKSYWKIISRVLNKCRAPKVPPLLVNDVFIIESARKATYFNDFFTKQCKPIINNSILLIFSFLTNQRINNINIENNEIINLIRNLNPNKAMGSDGISGQMLLMRRFCCFTTKNNLH